jgi:hypothetical protein
VKPPLQCLVHLPASPGLVQKSCLVTVSKDPAPCGDTGGRYPPWPSQSSLRNLVPRKPVPLFILRVATGLSGSLNLDGRGLRTYKKGLVIQLLAIEELP